MTKKLLFSLFVVTCVSTTAFADFDRSEILLNGMQATLKAGSGTAISATAGYNFAATWWIQIGLSGDVLYTNIANIGSTTVDGLGVVTLNIPIDGRQDLENAFFIDGKAGFELQTLGIASPVYFIFEANAGKRFELFRGVCYRPDIGAQVVNGSWAFVLRALSFSFMF